MSLERFHKNTVFPLVSAVIVLSNYCSIFPRKVCSSIYFSLKVTYCLFFCSERWVLYFNSFY